MKLDKLKKFAPLLLLIALGASLVVAGYQNGSLVNFVADLASIQEIDRDLTGTFTLENLPEFFNASVLIQGSGYVGQIHDVSVEISHDRPDESLWLASGNFSVDLANGTEVQEEIITGGYFIALNNTEPYVSPVQSWTPGCSNGTYDIVMRLKNLVWTRGYIITATVTGPGGQINPFPSAMVPEGEDKTFYIVPEVGYEVLDVLVDGDSVGNVSSYPFTNVQKDWTIHATFIEVHTITATAGTGGTIVSGETTVSYGAPHDFTVLEGANQTFTITPTEDYKIDDVRVDGSSVGSVSSHLFENVQADHTIHANFTEKTANFSATNTIITGLLTPETPDWYYNTLRFNDSVDKQYIPGETVTVTFVIKSPSNDNPSNDDLSITATIEPVGGGSQTVVYTVTDETHVFSSQAIFISFSFTAPAHGDWSMEIAVTP